MKNLKKAAFNVLSTTALLTTAVVPVAAVVAPVASFAAGSGTVSASVVPTIPNNGTGVSVGTVKIVIPKATLSGSDNTVTLSLPQGVKFPTATVSGTTYTEFDTTIGGGDTYPGGLVGSKNFVQLAQAGGVSTGQLSVGVLSDNKVKLTIASGANNTSDDTIILVHLDGVNVNGVNNGPQNVSLAAPSDSSFPVGTVAVANVQTSGVVDVAASDTQTGNTDFKFNLNLSEEIAGSLKTDSNALKIKLPSGYKWTTTGTQLASALGASEIYGNGSVTNNVYVSSTGDDTLYVYGVGTSTKAESLQIPLKFTVSDDTSVKNGPVTAYISGTTTSNVSSVQVGSYGDYSATASAASTPTVLSGKAQQQIGDLTIKESVPGTFTTGRTVDVTLPDGARWEDSFEADAANSGADSSATPQVNYSTTNGLTVNTPVFTGTDHRTLRFTINQQSSGQNAGEIDLKNLQVATAADLTGDVNVTLGGTAGVTGSVKVATAQAPGSISVSEVKNVNLGQKGQALGDITITEAQPGAFNKDHVGSVSNSNQILVTLGNGVKWDTDPTVTVADGDAKVTNVTDNGSSLIITLDSASAAKAATLKLTGGTVLVDRTVVQGPFKIKLGGDAVSYAAGHVKVWSDNTTNVASTPVGTVVTGTDLQTTATSVFKIGQTSYTVDGVQKTLDVAPYTEGGRTYLPIRFVAEALGVSDDSIVWDNNSQTVTLIKGSRVASFQVGKSYYTLNGAKITMDAAAAFKAGRNMIPLRYAAQALGANIQWDDATQTVTIN